MKILQFEQRSPEWYAARLGIPTASEYSKIITSTGERSKVFPAYAMTLAGEIYAGKDLDPFEGNQWTERGKEMEADAIKFYSFVRETTVAPIGFVTTDDGLTGCSPDGFIGDDGLIEVKCLKPENHINAILHYQKYRKAPAGYTQQTQGQMMVCQRQWCDLLFYHPELPPLIIRQTPDKAIQDALASEIPALIAERDVVLAALRKHAAEQA